MAASETIHAGWPCQWLGIARTAAAAWLHNAESLPPSGKARRQEQPPMLAAPAHCHQGDLVLHQIAERPLGLSIEQIAISRSEFVWRPHWNQIGTLGGRRQGPADRAALDRNDLVGGASGVDCSEPQPPAIGWPLQEQLRLAGAFAGQRILVVEDEVMIADPRITLPHCR